MQPGVGKTTSTLEIFRRLVRQRKVKKMLVIAPLNPCYLVWPLEIMKWQNFCHLKWTILHGFGKNRRLHKKDADIYIINPAGLEWLEQELGPDWSDKFDVLAIDESTKFKSASSGVFKLIKRHLRDFKYQYALTGTPAPEGIQDFYAQIFLIDMGKRLGRTEEDFKKKYFDKELQKMRTRNGMRAFYEYTPRADSRRKILKKIKDITVTLMAEDFVDLPEVIDKMIEFMMPAVAKREYNRMANKLFIEWQEEEYVADSAGDKYNKLRQIPSGFMYSKDELSGERETIRLHTAKIETLQEFLEDLGRPVLLAYVYEEEKQDLKKAFGKDITFLADAKKNKAKVERLWNQGKLPILAIQPRSGAHGLNLQYGSNYLIWYTVTTSGEDFEQMAYRLKRPGTDFEHIFQYFLIAKGTIDRDSYDIMSGKVADQNTTMLILKKHFEKLFTL